jgi:hypothetical protein
MKKKIATLLAGTVLLAPVVSVLPNDSHTPIINNEASAKSKTKYKLASVKTRTISVKEQKDNAHGKFIGQTIAELAIGGAEIKGAKTLMSAIGFASGWKQIQSPKHYVPLTAKKYHYVPTKKSSNIGAQMSGYNLGYYVIKIYNKKTGKHISSKRIPIQRA